MNRKKTKVPTSHKWKIVTTFDIDERVHYITLLQLLGIVSPVQR